MQGNGHEPDGRSFDDYNESSVNIQRLQSLVAEPAGSWFVPISYDYAT